MCAVFKERVFFKHCGGRGLASGDIGLIVSEFRRSYHLVSGVTVPDDEFAVL